MNRTRSNTVKIAVALTWEFWAQGWRAIVPAPLGAIALPGFIFGMLSWEHGVPIRDTGTADLLEFSFYWITLVLLGAPVLAAVGNPARRYALPASSLVLAAVPMACAMVTLFVEYALVALILNALFDAGWLIWGPGLLAALLIAWCQAVLWWHPLFGLAGFLPLLFVIKRWTSPAGLAIDELFNASGWHILSFGLAAIVCVVVGALGFANRRHGSEIDMKRMADWLSDGFRYWTSARTASFSSATTAQFWLEWTERGYVLPLTVASLGIATLPLGWFISPSERADFVRGVSGFNLAPLFAIGIFWGLRSTQGEFGNFNGSRPLSDSQLANAVLKSATLGLVLSAMVWGVCMAVVILLFSENAETSKAYQVLSQLGIVGTLARVVLGATAIWSAIGFVTSLVLAGPRVFAVGFGLVIAAAMAGALIPLCLRHDARPVFTQTYLCVCLVVCLIVVAATFMASWRLRLISLPILCLAAGIVVAALLMAQLGGLTHESKYLLPVLCACGVFSMPLAAAPLAVYTNRHS
jgi:hypothetical protein